MIWVISKSDGSAFLMAIWNVGMSLRCSLKFQWTRSLTFAWCPRIRLWSPDWQWKLFGCPHTAYLESPHIEAWLLGSPWKANQPTVYSWLAVQSISCSFYSPRSCASVRARACDCSRYLEGAGRSWFVAGPRALSIPAWALIFLWPDADVPTVTGGFPCSDCSVWRRWEAWNLADLRCLRPYRY